MFKIKWKLYYKWWSSVHRHLTLCSGCRKWNIIFQNSLTTDLWVVLHFVVMSSLHTQSRYQVHCVLAYILNTLEKPTVLTLMKKESERKKNHLTTSWCLNWVHHCLKRKIMVNLFESNSIAWSMFIQCSPSLKLTQNSNHLSTHWFQQWSKTCYISVTIHVINCLISYIWNIIIILANSIVASFGKLSEAL